MSLVEKNDIDNLKPLLADYLQTHHNIKNLKKPFTCLNPAHEDRHPSMFFTPKYNICKCFGCGAKYDLFDLVGLDYNVELFKDKIEMVTRLYPNISNIVFKTMDIYETDAKIIDFTKYFNNCSLQINKTDYLNKRGIDINLLKKYNIGYDSKRKLIIFPINKNSYFARSISGNNKIKSNGISYLWNENLFENSDEKTLIYVTESIIDSLSLETIDSNIMTVSLNGLTNYKRLLNVVKEKNYKGNLVLAFDNDRGGNMYQDIVKEELSNINISSFSNSLIETFDNTECKDLNEALLINKEKLTSNFRYFDENYKIIIENKIEKNDDFEI